MATQIESALDVGTTKLWGYRPRAIDYVLATGCVAMLLAMTLAIWRGREQLALVPITYPIHFTTLAIALAITPVMLLRAKGDSFIEVWVTSGSPQWLPRR